MTIKQFQDQIAGLNPDQREALIKIASKIPGLKEELQVHGYIPSPAEEQMIQFITNHPDMIQLKLNVLKLIQRVEPVLIQGESGTGKELIAKALHGERKGNFVAINVTSLPDYLVESELFGHVRGSFTGAVADKEGLFEYAKDGTIFLDEIGDMPYNAQAKLLRVLQERKIRRIGSNIDREINCRVICATHQDLRKLVQEKVFRLDLFYRISTFHIHTLPLRERPDDIDLILDTKLDTKKQLPPDIRATIKQLDLRGNVRELEQLVLRYQVFGGI